jgi:hypothetical protein
MTTTTSGVEDKSFPPSLGLLCALLLRAKLAAEDY